MRSRGDGGGSISTGSRGIGEHVGECPARGERGGAGRSRIDRVANRESAPGAARGQRDTCTAYRRDIQQSADGRQGHGAGRIRIRDDEPAGLLGDFSGPPTVLVTLSVFTSVRRSNRSPRRQSSIPQFAVSVLPVLEMAPPPPSGWPRPHHTVPRVRLLPRHRIQRDTDTRRSRDVERAADRGQVDQARGGSGVAGVGAGFRKANRQAVGNAVAARVATLVFRFTEPAPPIVEVPPATMQPPSVIAPFAPAVSTTFPAPAPAFTCVSEMPLFVPAAVSATVEPDAVAPVSEPATVDTVTAPVAAGVS